MKGKNAKFDRHEGDLLIIKSYRKLDERAFKETQRQKLKDERTIERNAQQKFGIPKVFKPEAVVKLNSDKCMLCENTFAFFGFSADTKETNCIRCGRMVCW